MPGKPRYVRALAMVATLGLLSGACANNPSPTNPPSVGPSATPSLPSAAPSPTATGRPTTIKQPPVPSGVPLAPESQRVDVAMPTFSNPTQITNPLFPVSRQESVLMLGTVDKKPFRTEVTLLPYTRIVVWEGRQIETLVSQYNAYLDGRIQEIAFDLYAQADDGSVWYFGEDVADLADGAIVTKEGTWLAGKDAPAAMIMPAQPRVGDVFRTENSPGFAFEEVTVKSVGQTLDGPLGPIQGGLTVSELHMDGATEDKIFAPGYGEFLTSSGGDVEALALAVPTDAIAEPVPADLKTLETGAGRVFDAAQAKDWRTASAEVKAITAAWGRFSASPVPRLIGPRVTAALAVLTRAVAARNVAASRHGAIEVARLSLDLQLRYRPAADVNVARFDLWAAQVLVDAAARDAASVNGDAFTLVYIRDRILRAVGPEVLTRLNTRLLDLQIAATDEDFGAAAAAARDLRATVAGLKPGG